MGKTFSDFNKKSNKKNTNNIKPNKYFLNFVFLSAIFMFCSQNLHAENKGRNFSKKSALKKL